MLKLAERENENCLIDRTHYLIIFLVVVVVVCQANDLILGGDLFFVFVVGKAICCAMCVWCICFE